MELEEKAYRILREVALNVASEAGVKCTLPEQIQAQESLGSFGISLDLMPDLQDEIERRCNGKKVFLDPYLSPSEFDYLTVGKTTQAIAKALEQGVVTAKPLVVYVDDEDENLFVFNRRFGKNLSLKLFTKPMEALDYIRKTNDVALVITDEVMPILGGNQLCDRVQETKPNLPFILITGNPDHDADLMYRSLRHGRFFEFLQKPLDLDGKGDAYLELITRLIGREAGP